MTTNHTSPLIANDDPVPSNGSAHPNVSFLPLPTARSPFAGRPAVDANSRRVGEHRWLNEPNDDYDYEGFLAEIYDLWFPRGEVFEDTEFYYQQISASGGKALDVGCGSGRLLVPFLQAGLNVEGLDLSKTMLERCTERLAEHGLSTRLYAQPMQELDVSARYHCIYVPFSSFQLLLDRAHALRALERFYAHLVPGGKLLVTNYIPWQAMHADLPWKLRRVGVRPSDGATVMMHEATGCDRHAQIMTDWVKYEVYQRGKLAETHARTLRMRWYHPYEFELMTERAGFRAFRTYGDYTDEPANDEHCTIVFEATK